MFHESDLYEHYAHDPDEAPVDEQFAVGAGDEAAGDHYSPDLARHEAVHAPDIVYTSPSGAATDLGAPDRDLDGDGIPESVAVRTADGDVLVLSDTNADGHPDQLLQIDAGSGAATWAVPDGHGGWDVVQTGHVEDDGTVVVDHDQPGPQHPGPQHSGPQSSDPRQPGLHRPTQFVPEQPVQEQASGTTDQAAHPDDNVQVEVSGRTFDAGPATIDTDGDGVPDTVAVTGSGGSTLYYQDTDGDGVADRAWTTDSGGQVTADYALEGGRWVEVTAPGRPA